MPELLIGTTNAGKMREYAEILGELPLVLLSLGDVGLGQLDVEETGDTYEANAELKARAYAAASGLLSLADDSGLAVDALNGLPGLYSHRYAGPDDRARYEKLLNDLRDVPDEQRTARFICVIALIDPHTGRTQFTRGTVEGHIAHAPDLSGGGFGYDPVFIPDGYDIALSALPPAEKNRLSHRGRAAEKMLPILRALAEKPSP